MPYNGWVPSEFTFASRGAYANFEGFFAGACSAPF